MPAADTSAVGPRPFAGEPHVHRRLAPSIFTLLLASTACNGGGGALADDDTTGGPGSTSAPEPGTSSEGEADGTTGTCFPGYETCPCFEGGLCLDGLQCLSNLCVEMPAAGSTSEVGESTSAQEEDTSTGEPAESSSSESSDGESSTTALEPVCFDGDTFCAAEDTNMLTCVDGQWQEETCTENCLTTGHTGTNCAANQQECTCDGFSDADCELDVEVLCVCYFSNLIGQECNDDQREEFYQWCYQDTDPVVACFGSYYDPMVGLDCDGAISNCL